MFTGLIQYIGTVRSIKRDGDWRIVIESPMPLGDTPVGASIACSGCCLTVVEKRGQSFAVDVSAETLSKTSIGSWEEGTRVNLEPSLKLGDELGGHLVSGHIDGLAHIESITPVQDSHVVSIRVPKVLASYIAPKGSVALDGISLTVNGVQGDVFDVNIIPHTWSHTTLGDKKAGDALNIEIDILARYVARQLNYKQGGAL